MPYYEQRAQTQFELNKDDKLTQALLALLGEKREQVITWEILTTSQSLSFRPRDSQVEFHATYKVVLQDGTEMRGSIVPAAVEGEWLAIEASNEPEESSQGECEECGGPCRWEYADRYSDEVNE